MIDLHDPGTWTPGREMDAKLAEIMGWEVDYQTIGGDPFYVNPETGFNPVPRYSTTYEGMGLLIEWAKNRCSFEFSWDNTHRLWAVRWGIKGISWREGITWYIIESDETLPMAVARAVLTWKG